MFCRMGVVAFSAFVNRLMFYLLGKERTFMAVKAHLGGKGLSGQNHTEQENGTGEMVEKFTVHFAPPV
jgi:hypothetical protein